MWKKFYYYFIITISEYIHIRPMFSQIGNHLWESTVLCSAQFSMTHIFSITFLLTDIYLMAIAIFRISNVCLFSIELI